MGKGRKKKGKGVRGGKGRIEGERDGWKEEHEKGKRKEMRKEKRV